MFWVKKNKWYVFSDISWNFVVRKQLVTIYAKVCFAHALPLVCYCCVLEPHVEWLISLQKECAVCMVVSSFALLCIEWLFSRPKRPNTKLFFTVNLFARHTENREPLHTAHYSNLIKFAFVLNDFNGGLFVLVYSYSFVIYLFLFGKIYYSIFYFRPIFMLLWRSSAAGCTLN